VCDVVTKTNPPLQGCHTMCYTGAPPNTMAKIRKADLRRHYPQWERYMWQCSLPGGHDGECQFDHKMY
jgi:hypothetical protein